MINTDRLCIGCMNDSGGEKVCSICGYDSRTKNNEDMLPARTWLLGHCFVGRAISRNGEGITYIGWDNDSDTIVNIREYFPSGAAVRNEDGTVSIAPENAFVFNEGIINFLDLQNNLKKLTDLPSLMPIIEVFEHGGTAYSISKAVTGITLREFLVRNGGSLQWKQARPLFLPLITTVAGLHEVGIIHRGISPETIIVGRDGKLRLTDVCIRPVRMPHSSMSVQLFPGFSAPEQYDFGIDIRDGRHTDVYAVAAVLFRVLTGTAPSAASERINNDNLMFPAKLAEELPKYVLSALANALQILPQNRTSDIESFRVSLTPVATESTVFFKPEEVKTVSVKSAPSDNKAEVQQKTAEDSHGNSSKKYALISSVITAAVFIVLGIVVFLLLKQPASDKNNDPVVSDPAISSSVSSEEEGKKNPSKEEPSSEKLYQVPDLVGKKYADVIENIEYTTLFNFEISGKQFSDKYEKGYIIEQVQKSDQTVKKDTTIQVVVSLGPEKVSVPNVIGKTKNETLLELLRLGFVESNITFLDVDDRTKTPNTVIGIEPAVGTVTDPDVKIIVRYNISKIDTSSSSSSSSEPLTND